MNNNTHASFNSCQSVFDNVYCGINDTQCVFYQNNYDFIINTETPTVIPTSMPTMSPTDEMIMTTSESSTTSIMHMSTTEAGDNDDGYRGYCASTIMYWVIFLVVNLFGHHVWC